MLPSTISKTLAAVSAASLSILRCVLIGFFNLALQPGYATDNPAERTAKARTKSEVPGILTITEIGRLLEAASKSDFVIDDPEGNKSRPGIPEPTAGMRAERSDNTHATTLTTMIAEPKSKLPKPRRQRNQQKIKEK